MADPDSAADRHVLQPAVKRARHRALLILAVLLALCGGAAADAEDTRVIVQRGRAFHPGEISISRGEALTFRNQDDFLHQIYVKSGPLSFDSDEQPPGQDVAVTFPTAGTFEARCHIHPKMSLLVQVK